MRLEFSCPACSLSSLWGYDAVCNLAPGPHQIPARLYPGMGLRASGTARNAFLAFIINPVLGFLLQQPTQMQGLCLVSWPLLRKRRNRNIFLKPSSHTM